MIFDTIPTRAVSGALEKVLPVVLVQRVGGGGQGRGAGGRSQYNGRRNAFQSVS